MRQNNLSKWAYNENLNCLLFFAQRLDELLFHHTTDTYRYSALSLCGLAAEYCNVYRDVRDGLLNKTNLTHIITEFVDRLKHDDIAEKVLTPEFVKRFQKGYAQWEAKVQYENVQYIGRKLGGNRAYYNELVDAIRKLVVENNGKKELDKKTALFVRELLDCGYNENYIYQMLHEVFFHDEVSSIESLEVFLEKFDFTKKKYDVYIGYTIDMSSLMPLYEKLEISDLKVYAVDLKAIPKGIKTKRQKTILKFEAIESCDMYSAFELANAISDCVANSYSFFRHNPNSIKTYGQVVDENKKITTIKTKNLLKHRVSALSQEASAKSAEELIKAFFANIENLSNFFKVTKTHNAAIYSENTSDSLLSLWSILESFAEDDSGELDKKLDNNDSKKERSKIRNIVSYTIPFLKSTYIKKLVQTCMADIVKWDADFFKEYIANISFGNDDIERTFAFLAFKSTQTARDELYAKTEQFPLLRYRVCTLSENFQNSKKIKSIISDHVKRVEWHLHRIYRARNYIIHDAKEDMYLNQELVINLHSYVDVMLSEVISIINNSNYSVLVRSAINMHKFAVLIMDEKLEHQESNEITEDNALQYLYYDFEK